MEKYLIGNAVDIHKLTKNTTKQKIGGILVNSDFKVDAHSDGDVVFHAISEAILGALSLGDLGEYFSDKDSKNKDLDSLKILEFALNEMKNKEYRIVNVDITIICEYIYLKEWKPKIKTNLISLLKTSNVAIKATRWEENRPYIQCNCVLLLEKL